jgi:D-glycero-D-manno-heptose 1,7-bisphosphate phosphatase
MTMKIVFLDRDGVINRYPGDTKYVTSWKEFRFLPYAKSAIKKLNAAGFKVFVVSNQAGVIKGLYPQKNLDEITRKMLKELARAKAVIDGVYYCIHRDKDKCACRKPKTGMLERALKEHKIPRSNLGNSFLVGDTIRDVKTGKNAGCKTILVFSGKEKPANKPDWEESPDFIAKDLRAAANIILQDQVF